MTSVPVRDAVVDTAKGICILIVVCIHTEVFGVIPMPFMFVAVPMFFFMSGFFDHSSGTLGGVLAKGTRTLLWPALLWTAIGLAYSFLLTAVKGAPIDYRFNVFSPCAGNGPCWFIVALFWVKALVWLLLRLRLPVWAMLVATLVLGYVGQNTPMPLYLREALAALPFYYVGKLTYPLLKDNVYAVIPSNKWGGVILLGSLFSTAFFLLGWVSLTIVPVNYGLYHPLYFVSFVAMLAVFPGVLWLSARLVRLRWLSRMGGCSLGIMLAHSPMCHTAAVVLNRVFAKGSVAWCACFLVAYVAIVLLSCWVAQVAMRRCPWLMRWAAA